MANSAKEAIEKDRIAPVDDLWIDDDWKKEQEFNIGFSEDNLDK